VQVDPAKRDSKQWIGVFAYANVPICCNNINRKIYEGFSVTRY
jgi:hypothetical protein